MSGLFRDHENVANISGSLWYNILVSLYSFQNIKFLRNAGCQYLTSSEIPDFPQIPLHSVGSHTSIPQVPVSSAIWRILFVCIITTFIDVGIPWGRPSASRNSFKTIRAHTIRAQKSKSEFKIQPRKVTRLFGPTIRAAHYWGGGIIYGS